ncbi:MAG: class I SAM-dependent methyltransferase, partial [Candidatus Roizmanbacteria bacterium]
MMVYLILYLLLILLLLAFLIFMSVYTVFLIYSSAMGSPYVATSKKRIQEILKEANLKKGKIFVELGCGDGRIVRTAVKHYEVKGVGIDINPLLIYWAKILGKNKAQFKVENIFD